MKHCVVCNLGSPRETWDNEIDGFVACDSHTPAEVRQAVDRHLAQSAHAAQRLAEVKAKAEARIRQVQAGGKVSPERVPLVVTDQSK